MATEETTETSGLEQLEGEHEALVNLIARCALRDQRAFKQLFQRTAPFLNGVAFRILRDTEASNDVLQEAFLQIWSNASSYRPDKARPVTWLASIVRYRALDRLEKQKRHTSLFDEETDAGLDHHTSDQPNPDQITARLQQSAQLKYCLETLAMESRQCIELAYLLGFSRDEIAAKMNANVNTIKSWLRRGGENLKTCLSNLMAEAK